MDFKIIDEDKVPTKVRMTAQATIDLLNQIPKGKAMVATEKELKVRATSIKSMIDRLIKKQRIPNEYKVVQRAKRDQKHRKVVVTVYIIHTSKQEEKC